MTTTPPPPPPVAGPPEPKKPRRTDQPAEQQPAPVVDQPTTESTDDDQSDDTDDAEPSSAPPAEQRPPPTGYRSKEFWVRTAERAVKSTAQVLVLVLVTDTTTGGVDVTGIDWPRALGMALGGGLLSVLTSIISKPFGSDPNTPSAVD